MTHHVYEGFGISSVDTALVRSYAAFVRECHLPNLAAEALRLLTTLGLTVDAVMAPDGPSPARRMMTAGELFLDRLAGTPAANDRLSPVLGAILQQALLAFVGSHTQDPQEILAIARTLAAHAGSLTLEAPVPASAQLPSHVAHDLRSPLNALSGALHVLEATVAGQIGESGARMLAIAMRNTEKLADLIDGLAPAGPHP